MKIKFLIVFVLAVVSLSSCKNFAKNGAATESEAYKYNFEELKKDELLSISDEDFFDKDAPVSKIEIFYKKEIELFYAYSYYVKKPYRPIEDFIFDRLCHVYLDEDKNAFCYMADDLNFYWVFDLYGFFQGGERIKDIEKIMEKKAESFVNKNINPEDKYFQKYLSSENVDISVSYDVKSKDYGDYFLDISFDVFGEMTRVYRSKNDTFIPSEKQIKRTNEKVEKYAKENFWSSYEIEGYYKNGDFDYAVFYEKDKAMFSYAVIVE